MSTYAEQLTPEWLQDAIRDFRHVAELAGFNFGVTALQIEYLPAPHRPPSRLPPGKMAVYAFFHQGQCLKVGKAGPNSEAQYVSQHYSKGARGAIWRGHWLSIGRRAAGRIWIAIILDCGSASMPTDLTFFWMRNSVYRC